MDNVSNGWIYASLNPTDDEQRQGRACIVCGSAKGKLIDVERKGRRIAGLVGHCVCPEKALKALDKRLEAEQKARAARAAEVEAQAAERARLKEESRRQPGRKQRKASDERLPAPAPRPAPSSKRQAESSPQATVECSRDRLSPRSVTDARPSSSGTLYAPIGGEARNVNWHAFWLPLRSPRVLLAMRRKVRIQETGDA